MEYTSVTNPQWGTPENNSINCEVVFTELGSTPVPFTANPSDTENPSSAQIYNQCVEGLYGSIAVYIPLPVSVPSADYNKTIASKLLSDTDWTTISDVSDPAKSNPCLVNANEFLTYRNAVRQYAIYPVAGTIDWPITPVAIWSS